MTENKKPKFSVSLVTKTQCKAFKDFFNSCHEADFSRVYLSSDLAVRDENVINEVAQDICGDSHIQIIFALPEILRARDEEFLKDIERLIKKHKIAGVLTGNLEGVGYFREKCPIYGDHNLYLWNSEAVKEWKPILKGGCLPLELNRFDQRELLKTDLCWEKIIYGRIPMMLSANCIAKTNGTCRKSPKSPQGNSVCLIDRMNARFPVRLVCDHCFNVIYNSVPLSLHDEINDLPEDLTLRIQLTTEDYEQSLEVLRFFAANHGGELKLPFRDYTKGHEKRGAQ